jgi:hypothetical protein
LFNQLKKKRSKRAQRADQEDILQSEDEEDQVILPPVDENSAPNQNMAAFYAQNPD